MQDPGRTNEKEFLDHDGRTMYRRLIGDSTLFTKKY